MSIKCKILVEGKMPVSHGHLKSIEAAQGIGGCRQGHVGMVEPPSVLSMCPWQQAGVFRGSRMHTKGASEKQRVA